MCVCVCVCVCVSCVCMCVCMCVCAVHVCIKICMNEIFQLCKGVLIPSINNFDKFKLIHQY